jgi:hypothetical protein
MVLVAACVWLATLTGVARASQLKLGDIFVGVGAGQVKEYTPGGTFVQTLNTTSGSAEEADMCTDGSGRLYTTNFQAGTMSRFLSTGALDAAGWGSGFSNPESCSLNSNGDIYTGDAGNGLIQEFSSAGTRIASFNPSVARGTDHLDLSGDQCVMYYTSETTSIYRYNVCTGIQMPDFVDNLPGICYQVRVRLNDQVMAACTEAVVRLSPAGAILATYPASGYGSASFFYGLALSPDGTTFWTADWSGPNIYHIDIASGMLLSSFQSPSVGGVSDAGLSIYGEPRAAGPLVPTVKPGVVQAQFIQKTLMSSDTNPTVPYKISWTQGTCPAGSTYTITVTTGGSPGVAYTGAPLTANINLRVGATYTIAVDCGGGVSSIYNFTLTGFQEGTASYTGSWTSTSFAGAWGGTARYSSASGGSATFTCSSCQAFAWVTDEDSTHGSAKVYVDGVLKTTINTQASTKLNRVVAYKYGWATDGAHTLKIVNVATSGHPRINVDGFLTRS